MTFATATVQEYRICKVFINWSHSGCVAMVMGGSCVMFSCKYTVAPSLSPFVFCLEGAEVGAGWSHGGKAASYPTGES